MTAATDSAAAALQLAIAKCVTGWRDRFDRSPTAYELVHAFEVVLAADPDDYVADPEAARTAFTPPAKPTALPKASTVRVDLQTQHRSWGGLDFADVWLGQKGSQGAGELRCLFEHAGDILIVDYWVSIYTELPLASAIHDLLLARAVPAWLFEHPDQHPTRARFRAFELLVDPVELAIPRR